MCAIDKMIFCIYMNAKAKGVSGAVSERDDHVSRRKGRWFESNRGSQKKALAQSKCFFQRNLPLRDKRNGCAVKCTCGAWNIRFADVKRQISYHRERSSLFHNLRQANYFTLSKSEIFHYIIMNVCIDKMIFCIYNERESQALERLFKSFFLVFLSCFQQ